MPLLGSWFVQYLHVLVNINSNGPLGDIYLLSYLAFDSSYQVAMAWLLMIIIKFTTTWMHNGQRSWHGPTLLILIIHFSNVESMPLLFINTINQTQSHLSHYTKFFKGAVGYKPLGLPCTRIMYVISFVNLVLPNILTSYPAL